MTNAATARRYVKRAPDTIEAMPLYSHNHADVIAWVRSKDPARLHFETGQDHPGIGFYKESCESAWPVIVHDGDVLVYDDKRGFHRMGAELFYRVYVEDES